MADEKVNRQLRLVTFSRFFNENSRTIHYKAIEWFIGFHPKNPLNNN